jgi:hypothetical protein
MYLENILKGERDESMSTPILKKKLRDEMRLKEGRSILRKFSKKLAGTRKELAFIL